jgi:hypothetical protein
MLASSENGSQNVPRSVSDVLLKLRNYIKVAYLYIDPNIPVILCTATFQHTVRRPSR